MRGEEGFRKKIGRERERERERGKRRDKDNKEIRWQRGLTRENHTDYRARGRGKQERREIENNYEI